MLMIQGWSGYLYSFLQEAALKERCIPCQHFLSVKAMIINTSLESCCPQPVQDWQDTWGMIASVVHEVVIQVVCG